MSTFPHLASERSAEIDTSRAGTVQWVLAVLLSVGASAYFIGGFTDELMSDDWGLVSAILPTSDVDLAGYVLHTYAGWYRPVYLITTRLLWLAAEGSPLYMHFAVYAMYCVCALFVGFIARRVSGDTGNLYISTAVFAAMAVHSEPVLWLAAMNEIAAALPGLAAAGMLLWYLRARRSGVLAVHLVLTVVALLAKETAVFLPVVFAGAMLGAVRKQGRADAIPILVACGLHALVLGIYLPLRLSAGSPYTVFPLLVPVNVAYYVATLWFALPDNFGYASALDLWKATPVVALVPLGLSAVGWLLFARVLWNRRLPFWRARLFQLGLVWSVLSLAPVVVTATPRTAFFPSIGVTWMISSIVISMFQDGGSSRYVGSAMLALYMAANMWSGTYRAQAWRVGGTLVGSVLEEAQAAEPGKGVCIVGAPDHYLHAYMFRNTDPFLADFGNDVRVYTDDECRVLKCDDERILDRCEGYARVDVDWANAPRFTVHTVESE